MWIRCATSTLIYVDIHSRETYSPAEAALKQISMYFFIVISLKAFEQANNIALE